MRVLRRDPGGDFSGAGVHAGEGRARLDRVGDQPLVVELLLHGFRRALERVVGLLLVAERPLEGDVVRRFVVELRGAGLRGFDSFDHRGERLVVDLDQVRGVAREVGRLGDDHRHGVAHVARLVDRQHVVGRDLDVREEPADGERLHAARHQVLAGVDGDDALGVPRGRRVDALDARVRVRAAHEGRVGGAGQLHVVDVGALAGDEARILAALDALSEKLWLRCHG